MHKSYGFSLLELLLVLSIVAVLSVITLSGTRFFWQKTQSDIFLTQLIRAIHLTRSEAIMRQENVILCGSQDQKKCADSFQAGYIIKTPEEILYHFKNMSEKGILHWRAFSLKRAQLEFLPSGWPHAENGTFWFCETKTAKPAWAIMINKSGRTKIVKPDSQGEVRDDKGVSLVC